MSKTIHHGDHQFSGKLLDGYKSSPIKVHKVTVTAADLSAAATTEAIDISTDDDGNAFPANARPIAADWQLLTAFSGGAVTEVTVQIGDTLDPNELTAATSVFTGGAAHVHAPGVYTPLTLEAAYAPEALFTSTTANLDAITAGAMIIRLHYFLPEAFVV